MTPVPAAVEAAAMEASTVEASTVEAMEASAVEAVAAAVGHEMVSAMEMAEPAIMAVMPETVAAIGQMTGSDASVMAAISATVDVSARQSAGGNWTRPDAGREGSDIDAERGVIDSPFKWIGIGKAKDSIRIVKA